MLNSPPYEERFSAGTMAGIPGGNQQEQHCCCECQKAGYFQNTWSQESSHHWSASPVLAGVRLFESRSLTLRYVYVHVPYKRATVYVTATRYSQDERVVKEASWNARFSKKEFSYKGLGAFLILLLFRSNTTIKPTASFGISARENGRRRRPFKQHRYRYPSRNRLIHSI